MELTTSYLAYIDPGSGSFLLQALVAGVLGAAYAIKTFWGNLFGRKTARKDQGAGE